MRTISKDQHFSVPLLKLREFDIGMTWLSSFSGIIIYLIGLLLFWVYEIRYLGLAILIGAVWYSAYIVALAGRLLVRRE